MKKNIFKFGTIIGAVLTVVLIVSGLFGFVDVSWLTPGGVGLAFAAGAGTVVQDTVSTKTIADASSQLLQNSIDAKITRIRPDLNPLDTIIRNMGIIVPVSSWETEYYAVETRGVADTIKTGQAATNAGSDSAAWANLPTIVTNIHIWQVDDVILYQGTTGSDGKEIVAQVIAKNNSTFTLTVFTLNGIGANAADLPALTAADKVTRIGNAKNELDAQTTAFAVMPQPSSNYCQIHMAQVEEGLYAKLHSKEVEWNMTDFRSEALYDLRRRMELTSLIGYKLKGYDSVGEDWKYFSGGVMRSITKGLGYVASTIDNDTFIGWSKDIFTGNNGSDERVLFAGSDLLKYMGQIPDVAKQLTGENIMVKWGIKFNQIVTNFGVLLVKHHATLTDIGYNEGGLVLDMQNIEKHVFKALETREIDLKGSGQKLADADNISEAFCLAVKNPDTHAIISRTS